ncbi:MAG: LptF/LptG family permease [Pirellulales bacterium]|nr:LptF/LptG family permease [Pirellulales bacterium]
MGIIDRYLLRQFLKTFAICFLSLMGLYVILDCTTHIDDFLRCGEKSGGVLNLIVRLYGYRTLGFFDRTSNILTLVSLMFTVAWIQRHNEMTALMAAGISRIRVIKPLIFASVAICLLAAASRETVIPRFREELTRKTEDLLGDQGQKLKSVYDAQTMVLLGGQKTYADRKRIENPTFLMPETLWQYGKQVRGENAFYLPPAEGKHKHPGGYLFEGVKEPKNLDTRPSLFANGKIVLITPRDMPDWLKSNQCFLASDLTFEQLAGNVEFSSVYQLIAGLHNRSVEYGADVRRGIHSRFVQPFLDIVLLFLALPLVMRRESRKVFLAIGICIGITTVFMLTVIGFQWLGDNSILNPALAAWAPLMIFVPSAVGLGQAMWE